MRPVLLAALTLALSLGCSALGPPSPVYRWEQHGHTTFWRFVPLSASSNQHPSQTDFTRAQSICQGADSESCLAGLGFYPGQCSDGRDNDSDGLTDHPADPGCAGAYALDEAPACDDDRDNDGDGLADWDGAGFTHPDPQCVAEPWLDQEQARRRRFFGLPF